jgi:hypothetical protein
MLQSTDRHLRSYSWLLLAVTHALAASLRGYLARLHLPDFLPS